MHTGVQELHCTRHYSQQYKRLCYTYNVPLASSTNAFTGVTLYTAFMKQQSRRYSLNSEGTITMSLLLNHSTHRNDQTAT